jgi:hypothetical protein
MIYAIECVHCQKTLLTTVQIGDDEARIVADHLDIRHPTVLEAAVAFDDPGLAEILHQVPGDESLRRRPVRPSRSRREATSIFGSRVRRCTWLVMSASFFLVSCKCRKRPLATVARLGSGSTEGVQRPSTGQVPGTI